MTALLEARKVTKIFGGGVGQRTETVALRHLTFSIDSARPSITGVVGESGSGKSTMARLLLGLETPTEGNVLYEGKDLTRLSGSERRAFRQDVQAVFQDPFGSFNSLYKVDHMLEVPIKKFKLARTKEERMQLMIGALDAVGLRPEETLGRFPHQLSGGQRQRIMVARALMLNPKLIVADEPVSMIDASLRATVLTNLRQLRDEYGISVIYITHDLTTAYQICDDIIVLYRGYVAEAGDVGMVVKDPKHPYTQLLVSSIPWPNPDRLWSEESEPSPLAAQAQNDLGCPFAARCPSTFEPCIQKAPPFFRMHEQRAATCYLYEDCPTLAYDSMNELLMHTSEVGGPTTVL
ncbi:MAG: ABC transporter ATP-binding protein [Chloroflexota bacterium]|nr:ABC transporter ATP-binding protein [Chloroflexota bacterium]